MSEFMNALYNSTGCDITGSRNGVPFLGMIFSTRMKYGADIQINVVTDSGDSFVINGRDFTDRDSVYSNLHVYF